MQDEPNTNIISVPHNYRIEQALLGAILRHNDNYELVNEIVTQDMFYAPIHGRIFNVIKTTLNQGKIAVPETLYHFFSDDNDMTHDGDNHYLDDLAFNAPSIANAVDYATILRELYIKRSLIILAENLANEAMANDPDGHADDFIERAEKNLYDLAEHGASNNKSVSLGDAAERAVQHAALVAKKGGTITGVSTGLKDVDNNLGGLHPSDLIIIAGRPAMGKTAFATNVAFNIAQKFKEIIDDHDNTSHEGGRVLFFSLEMSAEQLASRILAQVSKINSAQIRQKALSKEQLDAYSDAWQQVKNTPLFIDDTPGITAGSIRQRARRFKRTHGSLELIVIDYLQLIMAPAGGNNISRVQEISDITRMLKIIAKELDVPIIALSQLSRQVENREDKRPHLSDLRESGSIEQDADVVGFLYRPEYYLRPPEQKQNEKADEFAKRETQFHEDKERMNNIAHLIIEKQRHGPTADIIMHFDKDYTLFSDLYKGHQPQ